MENARAKHVVHNEFDVPSATTWYSYTTQLTLGTCIKFYDSFSQIFIDKLPFFFVEIVCIQ